VVGVSIDEWTWRSAAVLAAALTPDGVIVRANPALERLGGNPGTALSELIEPSQHAALERRLSAADDGWRSGTFAFRTDPGRPASDRRLWIAGAGSELLVIGEPLIDEQERLVEKVLELNDELVSTHRELVRQRRQTAELLERERGIAETLQRALLPERLPALPGARLAAHFQPAAGHVGGDWYDAVSLDSGELALAIGDVAGKGIPAAALMGELRGGLRAGVLGGAEPHAALRVLDRLCDRAGHMATAVVVILDPGTGALRHASAGHLPPAVVAVDGAVRFLTAGASTPLLAYDGKVGSGADRLAPGERLVLYTDRLVERRDKPIDASLRRLAAAAASAGELDTLADHLLTALRPPADGKRDDIAILAVERAR
jgi:serine phosphatase RsbU (regulator of sigma subunit)